jgi:glycosyltransferase involved in cell wall biosynthesis
MTAPPATRSPQPRSAPPAASGDVLFVVSAALPDGPVDGPGPRKDYVAIARELNADVLDFTGVERSAGGRLVARLFGRAAGQAWVAFRRRRRYRAILTDGEHIGLPLALLLKLAGDRRPHVTIGHRIVTKRKAPFFRWLRADSHLSKIVLHSTLQRRLAVNELGIPSDRLALMPYQVDTDFWQPQQGVPEERLICSAGLEHRDYPTLFRAVDGVDVRVVVGAASYWSHQRNSAAAAPPPSNVEIGSFKYEELRRLYARAAFVVVPLYDVDFQAGITTILEAMAMGKAVIVTHTRGQFDVIEDRRAVTRGVPPRPREPGLLHVFAAAHDLPVEPNGLYVPPGDPEALRRAITYLLEHPEERARLGAAGRRAVESLMTVDQFAGRIGRLVREAADALPAAGPVLAAPAALASGRAG